MFEGLQRFMVGTTATALTLAGFVTAGNQTTQRAITKVITQAPQIINDIHLAVHTASKETVLNTLNNAEWNAFAVAALLAGGVGWAASTLMKLNQYLENQKQQSQNNTPNSIKLLWMNARLNTLERAERRFTRTSLINLARQLGNRLRPSAPD